MSFRIPCNTNARSIKITFYTSCHRGSYMFRCGKKITCTSSEIRWFRIIEPLRELYENIIIQNKDFQIGSEKTKTIKNNLKTRKISNYKIKLEELRNLMNKKMKRCNNISNETGSSNWLSVIPMREFSYVLNEQQF